MSQFELKPAKGATKNRKRVGRGPGSGQGTTSGRGMNGQKSAAEASAPWFEVGRCPSSGASPKRGFYQYFQEGIQEVKVSSLEKYQGSRDRHPGDLICQGFVSKREIPVKILGNGELTKKLAVSVAAATKGAIDKIVKAGGSFTPLAKTAEENEKK
jgi:large subunit ribosomal protein L15